MKKTLLFLISALVYCNTFAQSNSPILVKPPNTSSAVPLTSSLQWNPIIGAINYEVWISTDSNFSYLITPQIQEPDTAQIQLVAGWLEINTTYYWKVRLASPYTSDFSATWSFTTITSPQQGIIYISNDVNSLLINGILPISQATILNNYLNQAVNKLNHGDTSGAVLKLQSFNSRVQTLYNSNILNQSRAYTLQNGASSIIDVISGIGQSHFILPSSNENNAHSFSLVQNYPNPFNPATNIEFSIPEKSYVTLRIYDINGKEVSTLIKRELNAGSYISIWDATHFNSGIYFYRLTAGKYSQSKKMILIK